MFTIVMIHLALSTAGTACRPNALRSASCKDGDFVKMLADLRCTERWPEAFSKIHMGKKITLAR